MYNDSVIWDKLTPELLVAADKYDMPVLIGECCRALGDSLSSENAARCFLLGYVLESASVLKNSAMRFIVENIDTVKEKPDWAMIVDQHPKALEEIFEFSCKRSERDTI